MRLLTRSDQTGSALPRAVPVIGLSGTVIAGVVLGLWMVFMAVSAPATSQEAAPGHGHEDAAAPNGHSDAGVVAMPGLRPSPPSVGSDTGTGDMAGMSAAEMAAMAPAQPAADAMAGMSPQEMAGMSEADMATMAHSQPAAGDSARPLAATLAGFVLLNLSVLIAAVVMGRQRRGHPDAKPKRGGRPSRGRAGTPPVLGTAPVQSATESAGSQS